MYRIGIKLLLYYTKFLTLFHSVERGGEVPAILSVLTLLEGDENVKAKIFVGQTFFRRICREDWKYEVNF